MSLTLYLFISKIRFKSNESNQIFVVLSWVNHEDWIIFKLAAHSCVNESKGGKYVQTISQIFFDKIHTRLIYLLSFDSKKIDVKREKIFPFSLQWLEVTTIKLLPVVAAWYGNILVLHAYFYLTIAIACMVLETALILSDYWLSSIDFFHSV